MIDARGLTITGERLTDILEAINNSLSRPIESGRIYTADFRYATFLDNARFHGISFADKANFENCTFKGSAWFHQVVFESLSTFLGCTFEQLSRFSETEFRDFSRFMIVDFLGDTEFIDLSFDTEVAFDFSNFFGHTFFFASTFGGKLSLDSVDIAGEFSLETIECRDQVVAEPICSDHTISIDDGTFLRKVIMVGAVRRFSATNSRFESRSQFELRWSDIDLTGSSFHETCLVTTARNHSRGERERCDEAAVREALDEAQELSLHEGGRSRILSLQQSDVSNVTVGDIDLRPCRFAGSHGLDDLVIESVRPFARVPDSWLWTHRDAIAEEHAWRERFYAQSDAPRRRRGWNPEACQYGEAEPSSDQIGPAYIAKLYRSLRRGREERGDEPGAADFYYGEMEMRRKACSGSENFSDRVEGIILTVYWGLSGYGLRASRSFLALFILIAMGWSILGFVGYQDPIGEISLGALFGEGLDGVELKIGESVEIGWIDSLRATIESVVFREPPHASLLTVWGWIATLGLRIIGPVLLALIVLSIRGRVKR